jgi:hypothetical protein
LVDITSPIVWIFAATLIVPLSLAFERRWTRGLGAGARLAPFWPRSSGRSAPYPRGAVQRGGLQGLWSGQGLYEYTVLATFGGSGSWLSPLYYMTLLGARADHGSPAARALIDPIHMTLIPTSLVGSYAQPTG